MLLFIISMLSIIIILISPAVLFKNGELKILQPFFLKQKIAPKRLFINSWRIAKNLYLDDSMNNQDWKRWKNRYINKIKTNDDVVVAVNTILASLNDKNTVFFSSKDFQLLNDIIFTDDEPEDDIQETSETNKTSKPDKPKKTFKFPKMNKPNKPAESNSPTEPDKAAIPPVPDITVKKAKTTARKNKKIFSKSTAAKPSPHVKVLLTTIAGFVIKAEVVQESRLCKSLKVRDEIVSIDGSPITELDVNSVIKLINSKNRTQKLVIIRKKRRKIITVNSGVLKLKKIDSKLISNNILLINVNSIIGLSSPNDVIKNINNPKAKGVIIDLRGNTGGLFSNAIIIADKLINNGLITTILYRNHKTIDVFAQSSSKSDAANKPIVVLTDKRTASSSEIFAGALKYNKKAVLVGMPTYGKNTVQQIVPMQCGMGMNITIAKYLLGDKIDINTKGIEPDYKVQIMYNDIKKEKDPQLQKAIEIINKENRKKK